jgi:hypothetical protein
MLIETIRGLDEDDAAIRREQLRELGQDIAHLFLRPRGGEREAAENEIEGTSGQDTQVGLADQSIFAIRVLPGCIGEHLRRDIDTDGAKPEPLQEAGRTPAAAGKVQGGGAFDVAGDEIRQVADGQPKRAAVV